MSSDLTNTTTFSISLCDSVHIMDLPRKIVLCVLGKLFNLVEIIIDYPLLSFQGEPNGVKQWRFKK